MRKLFVCLLVFIMVFSVSALADATDSVAIGAIAGGDIAVNGFGVVEVPADRAIVSLGVRVMDTEVASMQSVLNDSIASVRQALVDLGIPNKDITTGNLSVWSNYDYSSEIEKIVSYTGSNTLTVVVDDISMTGKVIDAAFDAGANTLDNVYFTLKDDSEAKDRAYELAVMDAMHKGDVIAKAAGTGIYAIKSISTENTYSYAYTDAMYNSSRMVTSDTVGGTGAGTDIQASGVCVNASVTIVFGMIGE